MLDIAITGGTLVDGTGTPGRRGDLGIRGGRIAAIGSARTSPRARRSTPRARSWRRASSTSTPTTTRRCSGTARSRRRRSTASPRSWAATAASRSRRSPIRPATTSCACSRAWRACRSRACATGVPWDWRTFGEYLDRLERRIAVNAGFMVGHSALRRVVMGERAVGHEATDAELAGDVRAARGLAARGRARLLLDDLARRTTTPRASPCRRATRAARS